MDAGWSAMCNWVVSRAWSNVRSDPPARVFSLPRIVGEFLGVSLHRGDSDSSSSTNCHAQLREAFSKASSLVRLKMWGEKHKSSTVPAVFLLAATFIALPCEAALVVKSCAATEMKLEKDEQFCESEERTMVEPQSGAEFPLCLLSSQLDFPSQVLAGVGVRCRQLMKVKSINLYAFGLYVHPESLRSQLGHKYAGLPPSDLKFRPEFYDDLVRNHEVNLTVRLVVLYKGLTAELIRRYGDRLQTNSQLGFVLCSAFQVSLRNRLKKIKGTEEDEGLDVFCSYLSGDLKIRKGTVIDIHWQPGGRLHTVVDGRQVGTIFSENLCRAFFDLYIGDPPVSTNAKHSIGESFAKLLNSNQTQI